MEDLVEKRLDAQFHKSDRIIKGVHLVLDKINHTIIDALEELNLEEIEVKVVKDSVYAKMYEWQVIADNKMTEAVMKVFKYVYDQKTIAFDMETLIQEVDCGDFLLILDSDKIKEVCDELKIDYSNKLYNEYMKLTSNKRNDCLHGIM